MLDEMLGRITQIEERAAVRRVFGEPVREHGRTIIPVARVTYGFGLGGGRDGGPEPETTTAERGARAGGGGGGGAMVAPVAVLELTEAGTTVRPIVDVTRLALAGLALAGWGIFWISLTLRVVARSRG
jgi:uncharacterized spore protein YtfJ